MRGLFLVLTALVGCVWCKNIPPVGEERLDTPPSNFIGEGTNELATALLQGFVEEDRDFVFSPLGYSVVLAILSEGARGRTRNQLVNALHLPEDTYAVRTNYHAILESMREKWTLNKPEFKNWFYVYKNYTVDDAYKKILLDNYFTEVKHVEKVHYELNFENENEEEEKKPEPVQAETEEEEKKPEPVQAGNEEGGKKPEPVEAGNVEEEKKPELVEAETEKTGKLKKGRSAGDDETVVDEEEQPSPSKYDPSKDVATVLTANRILDKDSKGTELDSDTKMIIFNGFYFRGNWKTPFALTKEDEKRNFYKTLSEKKQVSMMQAARHFDIGTIPELDCVALELPYEGDQYSMLILLPNQRDGLTKLTSEITGFSLNRVYKYLVDRPVEILLPKFQIQTISHPEKIIQKYGVSDIFTSDADLSGISSDNLKMGALVQLVNVQVDEGTADVNFLTTTSVGEHHIFLRNNAEQFVADHPFLFFIRDHTKNLIVAAGKVINPKFEVSDLAP